MVWKEASTIMIHKPNKDPQNPLSYRPISLLNIFGKILEKIIVFRLRETLESNNLLPPEQFGFRSNRSTMNPLLELHTDSTRSANLNRCTLAVFLDIERAFDKVWHDGLIHKLIHLNLSPALVLMIDSFLTNRSCKIKVNDTFSNPVQLHSGVPNVLFSPSYTARTFLLQIQPSPKPGSLRTTPPSGVRKGHQKQLHRKSRPPSTKSKGGPTRGGSN